MINLTALNDLDSSALIGRFNLSKRTFASKTILADPYYLDLPQMSVTKYYSISYPPRPLPRVAAGVQWHATDAAGIPEHPGDPPQHGRRLLGPDGLHAAANGAGAGDAGNAGNIDLLEEFLENELRFSVFFYAAYGSK
jgi:hypothetical protein